METWLSKRGFYGFPQYEIRPLAHSPDLQFVRCSTYRTEWFILYFSLIILTSRVTTFVRRLEFKRQTESHGQNNLEMLSVY
jgi:hypothetical protein